MHNKLALVLSGGFVKGAAHISMAEELYSRGYIPDVFIGTSIGAVFAVLLGLYDDPQKVKEISLHFVKKHIWPQLLSVDIFSRAGMFESKEAIKHIAKEGGFTGKTFKDLKKPAYITTTDLNTGKLIVFGYDKNMLLSEALEASISFPVIFKPKKMKINGKVAALADGGIRENCPITVAAKIPGVKRVIACDLGYSGQLKGDFNRKNMMSIFMQCLELTTSFSQINRHINGDIYIKNKIAVRIINPGLFDVFPFEFKEIPQIMKRSGETFNRIFSIFKGADEFFRYWKRKPFRNEMVTVEHMGQKKTNAFEIIDFNV